MLPPLRGWIIDQVVEAARTSALGGMEEPAEVIWSRGVRDEIRAFLADDSIPVGGAMKLFEKVLERQRLWDAEV